VSNGYIIYQGLSLLDDERIVVIATGFESRSTNRKTGAMIQTYILRENISPTDAVQTGDDASICGDCPHRGSTTLLDGRPKNVGRTCYVNVGQGALSVWRAYKRGAYPYPTLPQWWAEQAFAAGRLVRLGTYGDPAAVPAFLWKTLLMDTKGHTGYTHQWKNPALSPGHLAALRSMCMASVDSPAEAAQAQAMGWRTFRVGMWGETERDRDGLHESLCPASAEAGKKLTCETCLACDGAESGKRGSIFIPAHGGTAVMANIRRKGEQARAGE
jgi:hypothetical protein